MCSLCAAPYMLIYDRACRLQVFAFNREPVFFQSTLFRVDSFHMRNHTACSEGYNPAVYRDSDLPSSSDVLPFANTELAEQWNSALKFLKTPCSFMGFGNFMRYARTVIAL